MKVRELKAVLGILPEDMEVMVQTVPEDFAQPLAMKAMRVLPIQGDPPVFLITAFLKEAQ